MPSGVYPRKPQKKKVFVDPRSESKVEKEHLMCVRYPAFFINQFCKLYDKETKKWIKFNLWPDQFKTVEIIEKNNKVIIGKARQQGFTWTVVAYILHQMLFNPIQTILMFSQTDREATELLTFRLKGMYDLLPPQFKAISDKVSHKGKNKKRPDNMHMWELSNGSRALSFPGTAGGRSYAGTFGFIDEADYCPNFERIMSGVEPAVEGGGKLVIVSTADKTKPETKFKKMFREAYSGDSSYKAHFSPWFAHPGRTKEWLEDIIRGDDLAKIGIMDDIFEKYPGTVDEMLAPKSLDKRIPYAWLKQCYYEQNSLPLENLPTHIAAIPGLRVYHLPPTEEGTGAQFVISGDSAEKKPHSDDSASVVMDAKTGVECAVFYGKFEPKHFAYYIDLLGKFYCNASVMPERNNHGIAVIDWLLEHSGLYILNGHDGNSGWLSSEKGKRILYANCAEGFRNKEITIHSFKVLCQLQELMADTLRAPEGMHDDLADALSLAVSGSMICCGRHIDLDLGSDRSSRIRLPKKAMECDYHLGEDVSSFDRNWDMEQENNEEDRETNLSEIMNRMDF